MTTMQPLDPRVAAYLAEGPTELPLEQRLAVVLAAEQIGQRRRRLVLPFAFESRSRRLAFVATLVVVTAALIIPLLGILGVGRPKPTPIVWTPAALQLPFPAPLRGEPFSGAGIDVEATDVPPDDLRGMPARSAWLDPQNDASGQGDPRVDLTLTEFYTGPCLVVGTLCAFYRPAQLLERPAPDPRTEWLAYGIVVDKDGDGRADARVGIDNRPDGSFRAWWTDLTTGQTQVFGATANEGSSDGRYGESEFPFAVGTSRPQRAYFYLRPGWAWAVEGRFYLWSALIRDGRLVATDFSPDSGWLRLPARPPQP